MLNAPAHNQNNKWIQILYANMQTSAHATVRLFVAIAIHHNVEINHCCISLLVVRLMCDLCVMCGTIGWVIGVMSYSVEYPSRHA